MEQEPNGVETRGRGSFKASMMKQLELRIEMQGRGSIQVKVR